MHGVCCMRKDCNRYLLHCTSPSPAVPARLPAVPPNPRPCSNLAPPPSTCILLQCQHVFLLFHPPDPRPVGPAWLDLLLAGSGKLALLHRMLQVRVRAAAPCAAAGEPHRGLEGVAWMSS